MEFTVQKSLKAKTEKKEVSVTFFGIRVRVAATLLSVADRIKSRLEASHSLQAVIIL